MQQVALSPAPIATWRVVGEVFNFCACVDCSVVLRVRQLGERLDAMARSCRVHGAVGTSLQLPAVDGAGMGAITFTTREEREMVGAISLDEFASSLLVSLGPARAAAECVQAPLPDALIEGMRVPAVSELAVVLYSTSSSYYTSRALHHYNHGTSTRSIF